MTFCKSDRGLNVHYAEVRKSGRTESVVTGAGQHVSSGLGTFDALESNGRGPDTVF